MSVRVTAAKATYGGTAMSDETELIPAVCGLGGKDVRKEHLSQLPEVEELISTTAKGDVKVWAVFLQSSLLKILCALYFKGKQITKILLYFL